MAYGTRVRDAFFLAPSKGHTLWLGTAISHFQLNLDHSGDISQASQAVSTQTISVGKIRSGKLSPADL